MVNLKRFVFGFAICAVCLYSGYVRADVSDTQAFCTTMCSDGEGERLVGKDITALCLADHGDKCKYDTCVQTDETGWYWKNNPNHTEFAPKPCGNDWKAADWVKVETGCVNDGWIVYRKKTAQLIKDIAGVYKYIEGEWCKKCPDGMHANGDKCEQDKPANVKPTTEKTECGGDNCEYVAAYAKRCDKTGEDVLFTCKRDLSDGYDQEAGIDAPVNQAIIDPLRQECEKEFNEHFATECPEDKTVVNASLDNAVNDMNVFFGKKTVWRTEDGKFNTLRLASDATAGVVLGTVGGLVSAKVIKKKQLEKGYDVLNCTIGGQKMADWGDVFNVDLRR